MRARVILPSQRPKDANFFLTQVKVEARKVQKHAAQLFEDTTATWETQRPVFSRPFKVTSQTVEFQVFTKNGVYFMLNVGTVEHVIVARRKKTLAYERDYSAKTRPRSLVSYEGGKSGPWQTPKMVLHPGTDSRNYDSEVKAIIEPECVAALQTAISRWMKASRM